MTRTSPTAIDGSRRFRYGSSRAVVPYVHQPLQAAAQHTTALIAAPKKNPVTNSFSVESPHPQPFDDSTYGPGKYGFRPGADRPVSSSLAAVLRPAGASRWILPAVSAITPPYVEATLRGALAGNHVQAWEMFDLMIDYDPEIASCICEYVDGVNEKKLVVKPYTQGNQEATPTAKRKAAIVEACLRQMRPDMANDENDWGAMIRDILFARFHGQTVLEIDWWTQDGSGMNIKDFDYEGQSGQILAPRSTYWVHPVCYAWDMNGRLGLRMALESQLRDAVKNNPKNGTNVFKNVGTDLVRSMVEPPAWNWITSQARPSMLMDFLPNKFLIGIDKFKAGTVMGSGSELRPLAFWWIASMFCGDWLLNYAQLFGIPFRKATCAPSTSEQKKGEIRQLLESMGSAGYILLDQGNNVEFERAMGGSSDSPQAFLFRFANEMKRKVILRQTMSGGTGSAGTGVGKGGMDTEALGPKDQCINAGARFAASVINLQFIPWILNVNFGPGGDFEAPTVELVDEEVGDYQDAQKVAIVSGFMDVGEDWARPYFKIPPPAPGEKILGKDTGSAILKQQSQGGGFGGGGGGYSDQDQQQPDESNSDFTARCARNEQQREALEAASAGGHPFYGNQWTEHEGKAIVPLSKKITLGSEVVWKDDSGIVHHGQMGFHETKPVEPIADETWGQTTERSKTGNTFVREVSVKNTPTTRELVPVTPGLPGEDILKQKYLIKVPTERLAQMKGGGWRQREVAGRYFAPAGLLAAATAPAPSKAATVAVTKAASKQLAPVVKRLKSISEIGDKETQKEALKKFLKDLPKVTDAIKADPSLAESLAEAIKEAA